MLMHYFRDRGGPGVDQKLIKDLRCGIGCRSTSQRVRKWKGGHAQKYIGFCSENTGKLTRQNRKEKCGGGRRVDVFGPDAP